MKSAAKFKRLKLTPLDVMKPMVALLFLNITILALWTALDPLESITIVVSQDSFFRDIETYCICSSDHANIFLAILVVINLGSLLYAVFQAYKARHISTELQESNYIFLAMALIIFVSFLAIPVMVIARDNPAASYFVMVGLIFIFCTSILLLIFGPQVYALRSKRKNAAHKPREVLRTTTTSDLSSDEGMGIKNTLKEKAELELENAKLKQEIEHLLTKEKRQSEKLERIANNIEFEGHPASERRIQVHLPKTCPRSTSAVAVSNTHRESGVVQG